MTEQELRPAGREQERRHFCPWIADNGDRHSVTSCTNNYLIKMAIRQVPAWLGPCCLPEAWEEAGKPCFVLQQEITKSPFNSEERTGGRQPPGSWAHAN